MRVPFFYGWVVVAIAFVTMAVGVNARTAFSLFFPPILAEFGRDRGLTAGAFSFGFLASMTFNPIIGRVMDRWGVRPVMLTGAFMTGAGLVAASYGLASVFGAIPAELFLGPHFGSIFGTLSAFAIGGGAVGPWVAGTLHDHTGSYALAFWMAIGCSVVSVIAIWLAAPRKVRAVAGRIARGR